MRRARTATTASASAEDRRHSPAARNCQAFPVSRVRARVNRELDAATGLPCTCAMASPFCLTLSIEYGGVLDAGRIIPARPGRDRSDSSVGPGSRRPGITFSTHPGRSERSRANRSARSHVEGPSGGTRSAGGEGSRGVRDRSGARSGRGCRHRRLSGRRPWPRPAGSVRRRFFRRNIVSRIAAPRSTPSVRAAEPSLRVAELPGPCGEHHRLGARQVPCGLVIPGRLQIHDNRLRPGLGQSRGLRRVSHETGDGHRSGPGSRWPSPSCTSAGPR